MKLLSIILLSATAVFAQTAVFPGAVVTPNQLKVGVNGVATLLNSNANPSQTTFVISACARIAANVLITIDSEIMPVTGCQGTTLVVGSRGFDGTTPATHIAGAIINANVDAWHHNAVSAEIQAIENALGASLANIQNITGNAGTATTLKGILSDQAVTTTGQLVALCATAAAAGKTLLMSQTWDVNGTCAASIYAYGNGGFRPTSGHTTTLAGPFNGDLSVHFDLTGGGNITSSVTSPQTFKSAWFRATNYGARVAAAARMQSGARGVIDGGTGETGSPLVIADGTDIFAGCATNGCAMLLATNPTPIHCTGASHAGGGTDGCIVPRSDTKLLSGYIEQDNLGSMAPLTSSRVVDVYNDAQNVEIANLHITRSTTLDSACDGGSGQQHDISIGAVHNVSVHHNIVDNACGSGIALLPGVIAGDYSSGEVYSNRIFGAHRDDIDLEGVVDMDVHDNRMEGAGADFIHAEIDEVCDLPPLPNTCSPILHVQLHSNIMVGDGVTASNEILGPPTPTDAPTVYGDISIVGETISNSGGIIVQLPHTAITGSVVRNSLNPIGISIKTHNSQINGGEVSWDTPLSASSDAAVLMSCTPASVPNVGQGDNTITGVTIYNATRIGILNQGCNNSRIQGNNIQGIKAISTIAFGIDLGSDGTNAATGIGVVVQGNTIQPTSTLTTFAFGIVDNAASGAGVNYVLNNFVESETSACISGTTCQRYKTQANNTTIIQDVVPITYARFPGIVFGSGGAPAVGSSFFISDGQVTTLVTTGSPAVTVPSNTQCKAGGGGSVATILGANAAGIKCTYLP